MTSKNLSGRLLPHVPLLVLIIALIFLMSKCRNQRADIQAANERARIADSLRVAAESARREQSGKLWEYQETAKVYQYQAQQAGKKADSITRVNRATEQEIKQLYAELGKPWPVDTVTKIATECCELANTLTYQIEEERAVDSLKDLAVLQQLDLATDRVNDLQAQSDGWQRRYELSDSLFKRANKHERAKVLLGLSAGAAPGFIQGGLDLGFMSRRGVLFRGHAGVSNVGLYFEGGIMKTIKFGRR